MELSGTDFFKSRWLILLNVVLTVFMSCLDSSIINVALPVITTKLGATMADIQWVVSSYLIVIAATILICGRLGDSLGKMTIFRSGIAIFTLGSLLCGLSTNLPLLIFSRVVQALGAAGTMATSQGIITQVFPGNERGRALGISGAAVALGTMVGPALGGLIVSSFSWNSIFLINIPVGLFSLVWSQKILTGDPLRSDDPLDWKGAILFSTGISLFFISLTRGESVGYHRPEIFLTFMVSLIALTGFFRVESIVAKPLLQLAIFKNRLFSLSVFCAFISFVAISCANIIQPFYLQSVLNFSPATTGLLMMVFPLILVIVAPASGYLSDKIGSELLTFVGLTITSIGLFLMSTLNASSSWPLLVTAVAVMALGNGLFQSPNNSLIMSTVSQGQLGIAGGINALVRNLGMVIGISFSTALLYQRMSAKMGYHVNDYIPGRSDIFIYGMHSVYLSASLICLLGAGLTAYRLYQRRINRRHE